MNASFQAAQATYSEMTATNPKFKKVYDSIVAFRKDAYLWAQVSEYTYDAFMMTQQRSGNLG
jgi:TRAP-type mannitol/chloroaromatic compound transport system substrate-binding protein